MSKSEYRYYSLSIKDPNNDDSTREVISTIVASRFVEPEPALWYFFAGAGKKHGSGSIHDIILTGSTFTI